ncbi:MAG: hypothetical protein JNN07_02815 [Verrucomicrobiales bacterium]|nr:hypothetical protein [Verrucomicrobiales bacterium]
MNFLTVTAMIESSPNLLTALCPNQCFIPLSTSHPSTTVEPTHLSPFIEMGGMIAETVVTLMLCFGAAQVAHGYMKFWTGDTEAGRQATLCGVVTIVITFVLKVAVQVMTTTI